MRKCPLRSNGGGLRIARAAGRACISARASVRLVTAEALARDDEEPSWSTRRALLLAGLEQEREMPTRLKARAPAAPGL